ncbi:MAG: 4-hydroxy-tetrahydrodipicolinate reductase [Deltaproteobacteria bacterium]|uniref:4-hydroxy-tetrahydrodipicolinate reductase n=1 Tax=Candidatus Zymogenus saltonus TaxID=2844893 RepID=A0A9D8PSB1_9DELT|nr:4-hydroxy-tetrahydrodipicolinate reductase [Candidatus Zymogenus saltonus]
MTPAKINIAVTGAAGRMGKMVIGAVSTDDGLKLTGAAEAPGNPAVGTDAGTGAGAGELGVPITDDIRAAIEEADVLIDFSTPESTLKAVIAAADKKVAVVTGTTAIDDAGVAEIKKHSEAIPIVMAPNMSMCVTLLFKLAGEVAEFLGDDFDVEIVEAHHNQKVDAPSGTAKRLFEIISKALKRDPKEVGVYGREGVIGKRTGKEIGVFAVRAGDIVGEHTVIFGGIGERLELVHKAHSRMNFVRGAVRASKWIKGKPPGLYNMSDVLGI